MGVHVLISRSQWWRVVKGATIRKGPRMPFCWRSSSRTLRLCAVLPSPICKPERFLSAFLGLQDEPGRLGVRQDPIDSHLWFACLLLMNA